MEMATEFPECEFHGIDAEQLHPTNTTPSNCRFTICNEFTEKLPYLDNHFDYIHQRQNWYALTPADWHLLVRQLHRVCAPGGCLEFIESDGMQHRVGPAGQQINAWILEIAMTNGISNDFVSHHLIGALKEVGFLDVCLEVHAVPCGGWSGGEIGRRCMDNLSGYLRRYLCLIVDNFCIEQEEVERVISQWRSEVDEFQTFWNVYTFTARKLAMSDPVLPR